MAKGKRLQVAFNDKEWRFIIDEAAKRRIPMAAVVRMYYLQGISATPEIKPIMKPTATSRRAVERLSAK